MFVNLTLKLIDILKKLINLTFNLIEQKNFNLFRLGLKKSLTCPAL